MNIDPIVDNPRGMSDGETDPPNKELLVMTTCVSTLIWHAPLFANPTINEEKNITSIVRDNHMGSVGSLWVWGIPNGIPLSTDHCRRPNFVGMMKIPLPD